MNVPIMNAQMEKKGSLDLNEAIFGLVPREDILARVVQWQLAARQAGTHAAKLRAQVSGSTKKIVRQKGSGGARHGSRRGAQFRGGGIIFGPLPRSHATSLPKKVRALGLKMALSAKLKNNELSIVESFDNDVVKTKAMKALLAQWGASSLLIMDAEKNPTVLRACANLPGVDHLPTAGANVYDILRKQKLVLTVAAIKALEERLK